MGKSIDIKSDWNSKVPQFRSKVSNLLNSGEQKKDNIINPFLDRSGNLVNPYINYQKVLDDTSVSDRVKSFIQSATGLSPTIKQQNVATVSTNNATVTPSTGGAYTPSDNVASTVNATNTGNTIADAAQKYIGTPYVWGGESMAEGGMDCSGFVYNALKDAGYKVGRTTAQGYRGYGTAVSKSNMQAGDLVFFGKNGNASHIGIYLGNGKMIHSSGGSKNTASNPGKGVTITNVDYRNDFLEARRY